MCLAQGHSAVMPVRLKPAASTSLGFELSTLPLSHSTPFNMQMYEYLPHQWAPLQVTD